MNTKTDPLSRSRCGEERGEEGTKMQNTCLAMEAKLQNPPFTSNRAAPPSSNQDSFSVYSEQTATPKPLP
ncbi:hypothetical protein TorRG33x02_002850 [Trema orientale]|uniref:Uncharacterized protein n=1 Tax=Trema orientale TaxID=63057 RepID=A0A2P5G1U2_TREOI|nr:hypothetical protein TorRG33x02_002850 [Trema orientale]